METRRKPADSGIRGGDAGCGRALDSSGEGGTASGKAGVARKRARLIRQRLLASYDVERRSLPWRGESDPYRIWVSEVMLQQTRVETVVPYYEAWMARFPDLLSLAEAEEDEVLRAWQGLGYYSRARRLHRGARMVRERFAGSLPSDSAGLRDLPGVGEYTAGAVASIAFGEVVPAVDGNVRRVLSRLFDLSNPKPGQLRELAATLVDPDRPGDFNQAFMEFGSLVCTPRRPRCDTCPLASECLALERGTADERPAKPARNPVPAMDVVVLVAMAEDADGRTLLLLRKRPPKGLLAGMWEFPGVKVEGELDGPPRRQTPSLHPGAAQRLARELGVLVGQREPIELAPVIHAFSHLRARYRPYLVRPSPPASLEAPDGTPRWWVLEELEGIPLPVAQQKILRSALDATRG